MSLPPNLADPKLAVPFPRPKHKTDRDHLLKTAGTVLRVHALDDLEGDEAGVLLPLDRLFEFRVTAAVRVWRGLSGKDPGPNPAALPATRRERFVLVLRALDARTQDATYRDIAAGLFGPRGVPDRGWKTHDLRDRVIRLVRFGISLRDGGYRQLLLYPVRRNL
ncbi:MAG TPA: DUF2285 domain-containing protein [Rhizomicrobium sp.]|jgi:hypothetical protein|nr:DUF2285 domain-containing protein [Rhizomicrobium sp.]